MKTRLSNRSIVLVLVVAIVLSLSAGPGTALGTSLGTNPPVTYIRACLKAAALRYNVPSVILMAIAYQETGWRQFDANGNTVLGSNATSLDIGIMQINSSGRTDVARLMTDIDYNIDTGAKMLDGKWKLTPGIGDRDRNVLENWYYAIWAYNGFSSTNNPNTPGGRHFQDSILALMARQVLGSDGQPLWPPVAVTPPSPALVVSPVGWIPTPQPVHYGDLYGGFNPGNPVGYCRVRPIRALLLRPERSARSVSRGRHRQQAATLSCAMISTAVKARRTSRRPNSWPRQNPMRRNSSTLVRSSGRPITTGSCVRTSGETSAIRWDLLRRSPSS